MPILIDFHALKDILGPPMYEMEVIILISFVDTHQFTLMIASQVGREIEPGDLGGGILFGDWKLFFSVVLNFSAVCDGNAV